MLVVIGLFILAVLLFGSSAVLGALGAVLGFLATCAAFAFSSYYLASTFSVSGEVAALMVVGSILVVLGLAAVFFTFFDHTIGRGWHRK